MASAEISCVLAYDVGGSHISAALCFADSFRLGPVARAGLPDTQSPEGFIDVLHNLGRQANADQNTAAGAEFAMPGPFDYAQGISSMRHKLPYLYGVALAPLLAQRFGWEPSQVRFLNDAAAYLLGEVGAGAARGVARAVGITLGTGIGSAFAVNGRIVTNGQGVPPGGEIWNVPYEGGIVEDLVSTRAIQSSYRERAGQDREVASIAHYAAGGDHAASEVFAIFGKNLGLALRRLFSEFAPDVIVLGGGISRSSNLFMHEAAAELEGLNIQLRVTELGDNAPLVGAGVAWFSSQDGSGSAAAFKAATASTD